MAVDICVEMCGLEMFNEILAATITKLGLNIDVTLAVDALSIRRSNDLTLFMLRYSTCPQTVWGAGAMLPQIKSRRGC